MNAGLFALFHDMTCIAAATLITSIIWLLLCEIGMPQVAFSTNEWLFIIGTLLSYLVLGYFMPAITGCVIYVVIYLALLRVCMKDTRFFSSLLVIAPFAPAFDLRFLQSKTFVRCLLFADRFKLQRGAFHSPFRRLFHSGSLNPTRTTSSLTSRGRLTSIPSVASRLSISSSVMPGSFSFSCINL